MKSTRPIRIEKSWFQVLRTEFEKDYFYTLAETIRTAYRTATVYPEGKYIFRAYDTCPFASVKVVILGQDPYHEPGQAEGLSFSVPKGVPIPPSLRNILKEIASDTGSPSQIEGGNLEAWARQGVLLLNATLTVLAHKAGSHQNIGWERFTDATISAISQKHRGVVFLLWGSYARQKKRLIDTQKHLVLEAPHPSPLSAHRGFLGCKHFSATNHYLLAQGKSPIQW